MELKGLGSLKTTKPFYKWSSRELLDFFGKLDKKDRQKLIFVSAGGILFFFFIFWPAWLSRPFTLGRIQSMRGQIQMAQLQIQNEPKLLEEKKAHETFVEDVQGRLLKEGEGEEGIVGILAGITRSTRATLLSAEPQDKDAGGEKQFPPPYDKKYRRVSYLITVEGGYHQLGTLVSEIENHSKIFRVDELSIVPREENPRSHLGQVLVSAFALVGKEKGSG